MARDSEGDKAEKLTAKRLRKLGIEVSETKISGAYWNDGDLIVQDFMVDSKLQEYRGQKLVKDLKLKIDEFIKITDQARAYLKRPAMILHNGYGESFVVLRLEDFADLIKKQEYEHEREDKKQVGNSQGE